MELYPFNALLARMKYIARWGLMRAARTESLSEHTADAAILAHTLCLVSQTIFGTDVRPETVAVAALYHDASEILTGDMPTPVKYKREPLRAAYKLWRPTRPTRWALCCPTRCAPAWTAISQAVSLRRKSASF